MSRLVNTVRFLLAVVLLWTAAGVAAQSTGSDGAKPPLLPTDLFTAPSPEAASLTRYEYFPVDHASGVLSIGVPVFAWQSGTLDLGVSLSYSTGAVSTEDRAGAVGIGWTLGCGGAVTRQVAGYPDEYFAECAPEPDYSGCSSLTERAGRELRFLQRVARDSADSALDRYSYSAPGCSGTFYIISGEIREFPKTGASIELIDSENDTLSYFKVTAPSGEQHFFTARETSHVRLIPGTVSTKNTSRDYTYVSAWRLTQSVSADFIDTVRYVYDNVRKWERISSHGDPGWTYSQAIKPSYIEGEFQNSQGSYSSPHDSPSPTQNSTVFPDQKVIRRISTRTATVDFTTEEYDTGRSYDEIRCLVTDMTLRNADGDIVSEATLSYTTSTHDEPVLKSLTISRDGIVTDRRVFAYNIGKYVFGRDFFGHHNGQSIEKYNNVYGTDQKIVKERQVNTDALQWWTLRSVTDMMGAVTEIEYEPSVLWVDTIVEHHVVPWTGNIPPGPPYTDVLPGDYDGASSGQYWIFDDTTFHKIAPTIRVKAVTARDPSNGKWRRREFSYRGAVATADISDMNVEWFRSLSGTYGYNSKAVFDHSVTESLTATLTSSCRMQGFPGAPGSVVHSEVTETVTGSDLSTPLVTRLTYDVGPALMPRVVVNTASGSERNPNPDRARFLGRNERKGYDSSGIDWLFDPVNAPGYFAERIGGRPLLTRRSELRGSGTDAVEISRTDYAWFLAESESMVVSTHIEPLTYADINLLHIDEVADDNLTHTYDFCHFPIKVHAQTWLCDSVRTTTFYSASLSRTVTTLQAWNGYLSRWETAPGAEPVPSSSVFRQTTVESPLHGLPRLTIVSGPGHSSESHYLYADNLLQDDVSHRLDNRRTLMLQEVWISGADTLVKSTDYRHFAIKGLRSSPLLPASVTLGVKGRSGQAVDRIDWLAYSQAGHPTRIRRNSGPEIFLEWGADGDCLLSDSVGGAPGRRTYTHRPLVGCTSVREPWGTTARFEYKAGRLARKLNTQRHPVAQWDYTLAGCDTLNPGVNSVTETLFGTADGGSPVATRSLVNAFGMPWMTAAYGAGYDGNDVVTLVESDALGRAIAEWVPAPMPAGSDLTPEAVTEAAVAYHKDRRPVRTTVYDDSSRESRVRVTEAGEAMDGHSSLALRSANSTRSTKSCRKLAFSEGTVRSEGTWEPGALEIADFTDADGRHMLKFTDFRGLTVLERRILTSTEYADTYYVYDRLGRLRVVLPPELSARAVFPMKLSTSADFDAYGYAYTYDDRMLLTSKKLPGAEPVVYGYDLTRTMTLWSDGPQREAGRVGFSIPDAAGRQKVGGTASRATVTGLEGVRATATYSPDAADADISGHVYSVALDDMRLEKVRYYDSYSFMREVEWFSRNDSAFSWLHPQRLDGMVLGELSAVLSDPKMPLRLPEFIASVSQFDFEGRPEMTCRTALEGRIIITERSFDVDGSLRREDTYVRRGGEFDAVLHNYGYDHARRPEADTVRMMRNNAADGYSLRNMAVVRHYYDRLGRMSGIRPGNESFTDYYYNVRSQLRLIASKHFQQEIYYETEGATPQYAGGISAVTWRTGDMSGTTSRWRYDFTYDKLDRLTSARFSENLTGNSGKGPRDYSTEYAYDLNTNLTSVVRRGALDGGAQPSFGEVDRLTMTHDGNRLLTVSDAADEVLLESSLDYNPNASGASAERVYDTAGRLIADPARGIDSIAYNSIGLPQKICSKGSRPVYLVYDADGNRLAYHRAGTDPTVRPGFTATSAPQSSQPSTAPKASLPGFGGGLPDIGIKDPILIGPPNTRCFTGPIIYENGKFDRIITDCGYIADTAFYACYPDYQGNIRAIASGDRLLQTNHYYPYGLPFAEGLSTAKHPFKYGGKELLTDYSLNIYDFHARMQLPACGIFDNPDSQSESYYPLSPYIYCAGNPIRLIDPTGEFIIDEVEEEKGESKVVAVFSASANLSNGALAEDYKAAVKAGVPCILVSSTIDLLNALTQLMNSGVKYDIITLNSHGQDGSFNIGNDVISNSSDGFLKASILSPVLESKDVFIGACDVAATKEGEKFVDAFTTATKSNVTASTHKIFGGYEYNGGHLNYDKSGPYLFTEKNRYGYIWGRDFIRCKYNPFGNTIERVKDVTIDKNAGISHK